MTYAICAYKYTKQVPAYKIRNLHKRIVHDVLAFIQTSDMHTKPCVNVTKNFHVQINNQ